MKWPVNIFTQAFLFIFDVLFDALTGKFDFKNIAFSPLSRHAFEENLLLLTLFVYSDYSIDKLIVFRVGGSHLTQQNLFKLPLETFRLKQYLFKYLLKARVAATLIF